VAALIEWLFDAALGHFPGLAQVVPGSSVVGAALVNCDGVDAVVSTELATDEGQT
jgi:acyl-CoA reductase-like NAD-dependent aldehyde dehydrogenase